MFWSSVERDFGETRDNILSHKAEFEAEVQLAETIANVTQQKYLFDRLTPRQLLGTQAVPLMDVPLARNPLFCGRVDVLAQLHTALQALDPDEGIMKSCALHGIGGVGKTQITVEYCY
jgi:hypothetical protein